MKTRLQELRCACGKSLGKSNGPTEIKCTRCGEITLFNPEKLNNELEEIK